MSLKAFHRTSLILLEDSQDDFLDVLRQLFGEFIKGSEPPLYCNDGNNFHLFKMLSMFSVCSNVIAPNHHSNFYPECPNIEHSVRVHLVYIKLKVTH